MSYRTRPPCPSPDKRGYPTRRAAKRVLRHRADMRAHGVRAYLCECGLFHLGHLPSVILAGRTGRDDRFRKDAA